MALLVRAFISLKSRKAKETGAIHPKRQTRNAVEDAVIPSWAAVDMAAAVDVAATVDLEAVVDFTVGMVDCMVDMVDCLDYWDGDMD